MADGAQLFASIVDQLIELTAGATRRTIDGCWLLLLLPFLVRFCYHRSSLVRVGGKVGMVCVHRARVRAIDCYGRNDLQQQQRGCSSFATLHGTGTAYPVCAMTLINLPLSSGRDGIGDYRLVLCFQGFLLFYLRAVQRIQK